MLGVVRLEGSKAEWIVYSLLQTTDVAVFQWKQVEFPDWTNDALFLPGRGQE